MTTELATLIVNSIVTIVGTVGAIVTAIVAYKKAKLTAAGLVKQEETVAKQGEKIAETHALVQQIGVIGPDKFRERFKEVFHKEPYKQEVE